jgi:hypothetical protein
LSRSKHQSAFIDEAAALARKLQDRLVKELRWRVRQPWPKARPSSRLSSLTTTRALPKAPAKNKDLHRPLRAGDDLDDTFAWKEERTLSQALTLQYDKVMFILEPSEQAKAAIGNRVTVIDYPDGRLVIRYRAVELAYRTFDKIRQVRRPRSSRTNSSAPRSPSSARSSCVASPSVAVDRAGAISATRVSLGSVEPFTSRAARARSVNTGSHFGRPYPGRRSDAALLCQLEMTLPRGFVGFTVK